MIHRLRRWLFLIVLCCLALPGTPALVAAEPSPATPVPPPTPRFSIQPLGDFPEGYFLVELAPGESASLKAVVRTTQDSAPVALRAYRTNALNIVNGGFGAGAEEDDLTGAATWLGLDATAFALDPGSQREIPFTITVPDDAQPGQYVAALVAQTDGAVPIPGMDTFNQIIRSAISVAIVVPGEVTHTFTLGTPVFNIEAAAPRLIVPVANTGNYLVKPAGEIRLTTTDGTEVAKAPVAMGSVYGGYETTIEIALPVQLQPGEYVVSGTLTDPESKAAATIDKQTITLADRDAPPPQFTLDPVSIAPQGDPVQFADVAITVNNAGDNIPTATVMLKVSKDGKPVEEYPLARNQALASGPTEIAQRYIPATGWEKGTYTFEIVVASVANGVETVITTVPVTETIVIP